MHHRQDALGHRHADQPGAGTVRRLSHEAHGPGHRPRSADHHDDAGVALVRVRWPDGQHGRHILALRQPHVGSQQVGGEPDVDNLDQTGVQRPRKEHDPDLGGTEGNGHVGRHRDTLHRTGLAVHARGDVHRHHGTAPIVQPCDGSLPVALRRPAETGAEHGVDRDVASRQLTRERVRRERPDAHVGLTQSQEVRGRRLTERLGRLHHHDRRPDPPSPQVARRDQSVAAVVPLAAHDDGASPREAAGDRRGRSGHLPAGPLHQARCIDASGLGLAIEDRGLRGREDRLHRATATANATASARSCVNEMRTCEMPFASARTLALPARTIDGAPLGCRLTLTSCHRFPR